MASGEPPVREATTASPAAIPSSMVRLSGSCHREGTTRTWPSSGKRRVQAARERAKREGGASVKEICREHAISETLYYGWRDQLLEAGRERFAGKDERNGEKELRRKVAQLERALGRKTYERELAGEALRGWE